MARPKVKKGIGAKVGRASSTSTTRRAVAPSRGERSRQAVETTKAQGPHLRSTAAERHKMDLVGILLLLGAVLLALALYGDSLGPVGLVSRRYLGLSIGVTRFALPVLLAIAAGYAFTGRIVRDLPWQASATAIVMACVSGLADVAGGFPGIGAHPSSTLAGAGGWLGVGAGGLPAAGLGAAGTVILLSALGMFATLVITGMTLRQVVRFVSNGIRRAWTYLHATRDATGTNFQGEGTQAVESGTFPAGSKRGRTGGGSAGQGGTREASGTSTGEFVHDLWGSDDDLTAGDAATYDGSGLAATGNLAGTAGIAGMAASDTGSGRLGGPGGTDIPGPLDVPGGSTHPGHSREQEHGVEDMAALHSRGEKAGVEGHAEDMLKDGGLEGEYIQQRLFPGSGRGGWRLPPLQLLARSRPMSVDRQDVENVGRALVGALASHGVDTRLAGFTVGPTVTRYELELGSGVKVARVTSLSKDIAYAMASPDVRIIAPIPGKSAIGIEVPNQDRELVTLGDILSSKEARADTHPLNVALGRDISGKAVMVNLSDMPHLLISGATGSGKSSCINALITSLLMRATPDQVRLILIDPKRVELGPYSGLPHLLTEVVVDPRKAANALSWAVDEMDRRYRLLAEVGARDMAGYNDIIISNGRAEDVVGGEDAAGVDRPSTDEMADRADGDAQQSSPSLQLEPAMHDGVGVEDATSGAHVDVEKNGDRVAVVEHSPLPYIVVVVDELNDLMMVAARDVEDSVCRIAQMARAVGVHLVLATQRPSVDVITGVIKANVPSRLAFAVSSLADSRVILDQPGAERLVSKGDMLMLTASSSVPRRIQGAWADSREVQVIVGYWKRQRQAQYVDGVEGTQTQSSRGTTSPDDDELLDAALELVVNSQIGSTSMLQRKLKVGFARAGRLMDLLERKGVVGPSEGSKARAVLMTPEELSDARSRC
ncbi:MAG: DNA translocase FtsK [Actinobacteria bacterium]|nr:DNA translocase FtsK [Actinomycetota bacterium]MCL5446419.1 DNA translocase FtsK [Actinomycetota bacterium]